MHGSGCTCIEVGGGDGLSDAARPKSPGVQAHDLVGRMGSVEVDCAGKAPRFFLAAFVLSS